MERCTRRRKSVYRNQEKEAISKTKEGREYCVKKKEVASRGRSILLRVRAGKKIWERESGNPINIVHETSGGGSGQGTTLSAITI